MSMADGISLCNNPDEVGYYVEEVDGVPLCSMGETPHNIDVWLFPDGSIVRIEYFDGSEMNDYGSFMSTVVG